MIYEVEATDEFKQWLRGLRDPIAQEAIAARLIRVGLGNFGDHAPVGGGVSELRVHVGPGYRAYFTIRGRAIVIMLGGGDKSSQSRDINKAKKTANRIP